MRTVPLSFSPPSIGEEEIAEVVETLRSDWITSGPRTQLFEKEFAAAVGAPRCLALNSGTAALHLALVTMEIGPGDAVITTPMTFCSGVHVIEQTGAHPILVDVEPDTLNLDPAKLAQEVESWRKGGHNGCCLKAILPVHLYGHPYEMDSLLEIAREHHLCVIEDAAHALPARYKGHLIGSQQARGGVSLLTCFSFYATKNMTTAEGGMLAGASGAIEKARIWSLHGMSRDAWRRYDAEGSWFYDVVHPGFKYNMTDLQAAIGLHQLAKLPGFHARRREIARRYTEAFSKIESLQVPVQREYVDHAWHLYVLRLNLEGLSISRNQFIEALRQRKIASSVHFIPIHLHRYYRAKYGYRPNDFPVAYREYRRMISLPLHPKMSDQDAGDVIEAVTEIAVGRSRHRNPAERSPATSKCDTQLRLTKRAAKFALGGVFDRVCAAAGLAFLAPLFALIALAIKLDDGGSVFYSQLRVGRGLRKFRLFKFRSMVPGSDTGSLLTAAGDPRITRVGGFLRKYKLDELPQLVNVVRGEMRLVGVRPQMEEFVEPYHNEYEELLRVPPGITDPASLSFRHEEELFHAGSIEDQYIDRILPAKLRLSLNYHRSRTFLSDLEIIFRTVVTFATPSNRREKRRDHPLQPLRALPPLQGIPDRCANLSTVQGCCLENLLGREPINIDLEPVRKQLKGQTILVTGAAGTIGSELCRQVLEFNPAKLICLDWNETGVFYLGMDLHRRPNGTQLVFCITDFGMGERMRALLAEHKPGVIFHAAAYKHVPMMESNVYDAVKNNIFALQELLEMAEESGCPRFVLISSDKAVNPVNMMGATKRVGELMISCRPPGSIRCVSVRFGNVLGSNGSVVPILQKQLLNHEPLTITHPEATRFFMTTHEAVSLVLQALTIGNHGDTLLLEMGKPVRIMDLAKSLVHLSGKSASEVEIRFTGLRDGEKLFEELSYPYEGISPTTSPKIGRIRGTPHGWAHLSCCLYQLRQSTTAGSDAAIRAMVKQIVPEYSYENGSFDHMVAANSEAKKEAARVLHVTAAFQ